MGGGAILYIKAKMVFVHPGADIGFRTLTNGQDLDGRTRPGLEIEVRRSAQG
jgi:hypothetical protein